MVLCHYCEKKLKEDHLFCPYCGENLESKDRMIGFGFYSPFIEMFDSVSDAFKGFDELFEMPDFDKLKKSPDIKFSGIDIKVTNINGKPDIKVKTFGDFKKYEPEILKKLGVKKKKVKKKSVGEKVLKKPDVKYEEIKGANIRKLDNKIIYEFDMPGIANIKNVRIKKLDSSYEIRALGKDKAYFKLLPLTLDILSHKIENEKLIIEFSAD